MQEVKKDFTNKLAKKKMKEPDDFWKESRQSKSLVLKNNVIFSKQWYFEGMGENQNGFRKDQERKGQPELNNRQIL